MLLKSALLTSALLLSAFSYSHESHKHGAHEHHHHQVTVSNATIRAFLPAAKSTAGYLEIHNPTATNLVLTKAEIAGIGRVEIHEHVHVDGMMRMQEVKSLEIPANQKVVFQPGGYHLMAFEPAVKLTPGEKVKVTLYFSNGDRIFSFLNVVSLKDAFKKSTHSHHNHH